MRKYSALFCFLLPFFLLSQNRKGQFFIHDDSKTYDLYVAFDNSDALNLTFNILNQAKIDKDFTQIITSFSIQFEKGIAISDLKLVEMEHNTVTLKKCPTSIYKLRNIYKVKFENPTNDRILKLANELEKLHFVSYCDIISNQPMTPPTDIAPTTSNYEMNQTYIQVNPGVNMQYAWDLGFNGQGIKMRDIEYGFNKNHEELNSVTAFLADGMTISSSADASYTEHGTGVFGILYADKGTYGISGLAHGASELILFPEWQQTGYDRVYAVSQAISNSTLGDVIIYEMQADGPTTSTTDFVPAEYSQVVWDLTRAATDSGIIVVAAAGNGNQNLDGTLYTSYMARGNSGAIIVGAGSSDINHNKLSYSTYGNRVDLQGWGSNVLSTGKINGLTGFQINNDFNQSYLTFTGTSAATPIVASCAVVLQSYYYSLFSSYMTNDDLLTLLKTTGVAQGSGGNIGPLPNMQLAMQTIYNAPLSSNSFEKNKIIVFPNPASNEINFRVNDLVLTDATIEIVNSLGQLVYQNTFNSSEAISISHLPMGVYFLKIVTSGFSFNQTIVKK